MPQPKPDAKDDAAADDDLTDCLRERAFHKSVAYIGNRQQFDHDYPISNMQGDAEGGNQKRECVQHSADRCGEAGDRAAQDRLAASGDFAIIGKRFGQTHADTRTYRGREANKERFV